MKLGTRSLIFGCHQFIIHPFFILKAWRIIYKGHYPPGRWWERWLVALTHDWGYWGCATMDGFCGDDHSKFGARIIYEITKDLWWYEEVLYHSRFYAARMGAVPSTFCWVDKLAITIMPRYLWVILAKLSGEGREYLANPMYEEYNPQVTEPSFRNLARRHILMSSAIEKEIKRKGFDL